LLLCTTRVEIPPEGNDRIRSLLQKGIDWEELYRLARLHGVTPLLYWHLNSHYQQEVPNVELERLRECFIANAASTIFLMSELLNLLGSLEAEGIAAIPFKGVALAASVYENVVLRQAGDLDILVQKWDVLKAREVLLNNHYLPRRSISQNRIAEKLRSHHEFGFVSADDSVVVELQWDITRCIFSSPIDFEGLWQRLQPITLDGVSVPSFAAEDLLLLLCVHGNKHCWSRLGWICDVAELVRRRVIDWEQVLNQASRLGGVRILFTGLSLANDLLGLTLPHRLLRRIETDRAAKSLAGIVGERLFRATHGVALGRNPIHTFYFKMRSRERIPDKIRCFIYLMTPNLWDQNLVPLPRGPSFIHYLVRPLRAFRERKRPRVRAIPWG
jgi:hypothetical protein